MTIATLLRFGLGLALATLAAVSPAAAQQPIKLLAGYPPGGGSDAVARALAEKLQAKLGQTVIVENKPGAGGVIAAQALKAAPADGSTFLVASDQLYIAKLTMQVATYDPLVDFAPIAAVNTFDVCLAANAGKIPAMSLKDYLALVKKEQALNSYGVPAPGSLPQFYGYVIGKSADVPLNSVPYRGAAPMLLDLVSGVLPAAIGPCREVMQHVKDGKVRILATMQKLSWAPDIATFADNGIKMGQPSWMGIYAASSMPAEKRSAMETAIREIMDDATFRERIATLGFTPKFVAGKDLAVAGQEAFTYWGEQIRASGFKPE